MTALVINPGDLATAAIANEYFNQTTRFVQKGSDQVVNNSATPVNDTGLVFTGSQTLSANAIYMFTAYVVYTSATGTPDLKVNFTFGATATFHWMPLAIGDLSASTEPGIVRTVDHSASGSFRSIAATNFPVVCLVHGVVSTGASSGDLTFQWCQNTATAENTTVKAGSWMQATRVG